MSTAHTASSGNAFLDALCARFPDRLTLIEERRKSHDVVIPADAPAEWLYFPHRGSLLSLTRSADNGATVEVGLVGYEGLATMHALLTPDSFGVEGVVQIAGPMTRASLAEIRDLMHTDEHARELIFTYTGALLSQVSQHALCNRLHTVEQRLAKWLLSVRDRIDTDDIALTHDFLSHMLGIRRSGVTVAIGALALDALITHSRNSVIIVDREGLEHRACECYSVLVESTQPVLDKLQKATSAPAHQAR